VMSEKKTYFEQLDGIRFIAVFLVLVDHWLAERNIIPFGPLGVTLFFVLSGFLITRILILSKQKDIQLGRSHWFSVKQFIIRRSLRIFPIYYLTIFLCLLWQVPGVRENWLWCITYTTNLYVGLKGTWMGVIDHTWSLAVEEQFYLIFPYFILFLPQRLFLRIFIGMILISVGFRWILWFNGADWTAPYVLMPACLDAFGLGALLSYLFTFHAFFLYSKITRYQWIILSFLFFCMVLIWEKKGFSETHNLATDVLERLAGAIFSFFLIAQAVKGFKGSIAWFLTNPVVNYLGKISYGLYLYHNFVYNFYHSSPRHPTILMYNKLLHFLPFLSKNIVFEISFYFLLTVLVATVSWYLIEKPVNQLKRFFAY
jgi:peptidoglycan/LPS O-acetylase OafA/YrhL